MKWKRLNGKRVKPFTFSILPFTNKGFIEFLHEIWYEMEALQNFWERMGSGMFQTFQVRTSKKTELIDITSIVQEAVRKRGVKDGICFIFVPHTTAAVTINENADPSVPQDIVMEINKIVPFEDRYHHLEGNSPAHIKASLIGNSETIFVDSGRLVLGTWQGVFFYEFDGPRNRSVHINVISDGK